VVLPKMWKSVVLLLACMSTVDSMRVFHVAKPTKTLDCRALALSPSNRPQARSIVPVIFAGIRRASSGGFCHSLLGRPLKADGKCMVDRSNEQAEELIHLMEQRAEAFEHMEGWNAKELRQLEWERAEELMALEKQRTAELEHVEAQSANALRQLDKQRADEMSHLEMLRTEMIQLEMRRTEHLQEVENQTAQELIQMERQRAEELRQLEKESVRLMQQVEERRAELVQADQKQKLQIMETIRLEKQKAEELIELAEERKHASGMLQLARLKT
jgi:hypothetical protein